MRKIKIVITGAFSAGKSHFIRAISDIEVASTEYEVSAPEERLIKSESTIALDFGMAVLSDEAMLYLFGTPGQERFEYMWEILSTGCTGYIVLVDSAQPTHFTATARLMARFAELTAAPFVVAANKQDDPAALPLSSVREQLQLPHAIPLFPCVATDKESVRQVLLGLLAHIDAHSAATQMVEAPQS